MKPIKTIILFTIISVLIILVLIYYTLKESFIDGFDLSTSEAGYIGSTIGGIAVPVFTLLSAVLVYLAFVKQTESNDNQRLKNDSDIIFMLFNQLEQEMREIEVESLTSDHGNVTKRIIRGYKAFHKTCYMYNNSFAQNFGNQNPSNMILYILYSFEALQSLLEKCMLTEDLKIILEKKVHSFYLTKLRDPLRNLCFEIKNNNDTPSSEVLSFFIKQEKRINENFDLYSFVKKEDLFEDK